VVDLDTGRIVGFEMLARWHSPAFGVVSPDVFIPIAEEIGVISDLGEVLLAQALQDARHWSPSLILSVNVSPMQLRDPWFAQRSSSGRGQFPAQPPRHRDHRNLSAPECGGRAHAGHQPEEPGRFDQP
jgi:EAL domain-containing protein (putative c-di-GMP-specific phosphodiesterase class I)